MIEKKILVGAPGTGKSFELKEKYIENIEDYQYERITFFPEYDYQDFVGSITPVIEKNQLIYTFVPGPITRIIKKALEDQKKQYYLIVEEMTRGNCSAIFGDIFQLLDVNYKGISEYPINNSLMANYIFNDKNKKVYLPGNLNILGTVNSSDQNVYPMDTAFKRRFQFEHISVEKNREKIKDYVTVRGYKWKDLYMVINEFIIEEMGLSEDKQVGPFFIKDGKEVDKLLLYLWDDVQKISSRNIFIGEIKTKSQLLDYAKNDENIWVNGITESIEKTYKSKKLDKEENGLWSTILKKRNRNYVLNMIESDEKNDRETGRGVDKFIAAFSAINEEGLTFEIIFDKIMEFNKQGRTDNQKKKYKRLIEKFTNYKNGMYSEQEVELLMKIKDKDFYSMSKQEIYDFFIDIKNNEIYKFMSIQESWCTSAINKIGKELNND